MRAEIVGTTNCEAFAFSGAGHTCNAGPVRNPHPPAHNPGGSSSGSAVVLAMGQADVAIGGDQGGSIRLPPPSWSGVPRAQAHVRPRALYRPVP